MYACPTVEELELELQHLPMKVESKLNSSAIANMRKNPPIEIKGLFTIAHTWAAFRNY